MRSVSNIAKKLSQSTVGNKSYGYIWIIVIIFLAAIILFAVFFPKRFNAPVPENFASYDDLMENLNEGGDLDSVFQSTEPTMVMFFAPWCGHCVSTKPEFENLIQSLKGTGKSAVMVDCDANPEIGEKYGVKGFPTIKYFKNGLAGGDKGEEVSGARSVDNWMTYFN